jgi:hypothetical protein
MLSNPTPSTEVKRRAYRRYRYLQSADSGTGPNEGNSRVEVAHFGKLHGPHVSHTFQRPPHDHQVLLHRPFALSNCIRHVVLAAIILHHHGRCRDDKRRPSDGYRPYHGRRRSAWGGPGACLILGAWQRPITPFG